jgi:hypothetical protein
VPIDSLDSTQAILLPRRPMLVRRSLGVFAFVALALAVIGLARGWPHVWAICAVAGVLMLIDLRLMLLARPIVPKPSDTTMRRRTVATVVAGLAFIAVAIAASMFEGWGWQVVGIGSLVALALMILISMPLLAASAHDAVSDR